jgi:hypothetical protein
MKPDELIREVEEHASEWLEMSEDPAKLLAGILAAKIIKLTEYIEYLEKINEHIYR